MGVEEGAAPSPQWRGRGTGELYVLRLLLKAVPRGGCELSLPAALRLQAAGLGQQTGSAGLGAGQDRGRGGVSQGGKAAARPGWGSGLPGPAPGAAGRWLLNPWGALGTLQEQLNT